MQAPNSSLLRRLSSAVVVVLSSTCIPAAFAVDLSRAWPVTGSGAVLRETRAIPSVQGLRLSTSARVVVRQGSPDTVEVQGEANVIALIATDIENDTLVIEDSKHFKSPNAQVTVTVSRLESIKTTGSTAVTADGLRLPQLSISMGGSSAVSLNAISVGRLNAALGGSSALRLSGLADELSLKLGGSGAVQARELEVRAVSVAGGGSSQAVVWAKSALTVSIGGSAGVAYYGAAAAAVASSGSSTVRRLGDAPPR